MVIIEECSPTYKYHVFLSFRGEDTRNNFTGHLYSALREKGIFTFMDDQLIRGEEISPALIQAIEQSKISIVVFSGNYASSKWCLDELVKILDCKKKIQQIVLPVFFKVDPSDVRNHRGSFGEGLANLERKFKDEDQVQEWKTALFQAASLSGWHLDEHCSESSIVGKIVEHISKEHVNSTDLDVAEYQVGIQHRVRAIQNLLGVEVRDVHMVGIWGVGGIGKTTIAKAVYNSIVHRFDGSCFLENVRENSKGARGLVELQKILLREILKEREVEVTSVARGINMIKERLQYKRVLLVLDDVSDMNQLNNLARQCSWFGMGSRIIITTRDRKLLRCHGVRPDLIYEVQELDEHDALELLSVIAFKRIRPLDSYAELTKRAVRYTQGLPLALTVLGSSLRGGNVELWEAALDGSESREIKDVLKISFDGLDHRAKEAFLDIACFFKGEHREHVIKILKACGSEEHFINVLIEKALISVRYMGKIWMHDLIEEMGRDIVHEQSPDNPGNRSRLWFHEDVYRVLVDNIGTNNVRGIKVELPEDSDVICLCATSFSSMKNLKLIICRAGRYSGVVDGLPNSLRVIDWPDCPLQVLPSHTIPRELSVIHMPRSRIKVLGDVYYKRLINLTSINLRDCQYLTKVSDLSGIPNLQSLILDSCENLVEVHPSVGFLDRLNCLDLSRCCRLETVPMEVSWKSMRSLLVPYCRRLENFINIVHEIESIKKLDLSFSGIKELHSWIGHCTSLEHLALDGTPIKQLPSTIGNLTSLTELGLSRTLLKELPCSIGCLTSLVTLDAWGSLIEVLPSSIGDLTSLRSLDMSKTPLKELPSSIGCLTSLWRLDASETLIEGLPLSIGNLIGLERLELRGCANLTNVPHSVYGGLQGLHDLDLSWCPKLVTFPSRASGLVSSSSESLLLMLPTDSNNGHDHPGSLLFPQLHDLIFEGCELSAVSDFLTNLDCKSTLERLNLSGINFDSLPACIGKFLNLDSLYLGGCKRLRDISELPPNLRYIELDDCVLLERFSKLSDILEQKDTPGLIRRMTLSNCNRLMDNLGIDLVSKMAKALPYQMVLAGLDQHVLSWNLRLPSLLEIEVPRWFDRGEEWKTALFKAASLSGWPLDEHHSESSIIGEIVAHISKEHVNSTDLDVAEYQVGIQHRVQAIQKLLGVEGRDVHMVGIWGAGGIGKTTIAKALYNSIAQKFDGSCFLENVRENSEGARGLVELQKILLREILKEREVEVTSVARGISMIKERLQHKSVLLVLDDVSDMNQLNNLARQCSWFGTGSRIIITTRDKKLLRSLGVHPDLIYEVQELDSHDALELFSMNAFKRSRPLDDYAELTERAVRYAQGLPLVLTVLGSSLRGGNIEQWEAALDGSESREIKDVLKISIDGLDHKVKEAFLDIACFFKGEDREHVIKIIKACGGEEHFINVLIEKALISVGDGPMGQYPGDKIWMHDLIEEMGRDIVHEQSPDDPGNRSRLWFHEDVYRVLVDNIGTNNVRGIKVELPQDSDVLCLCATSFSSMKNLKLIICRAGRYSGVVNGLPNSLRVIDWPDCPLQVLPSHTLPRELSVIRMPGSRIKVLGDVHKRLINLTSINLLDCQCLTIVSDLSGIPNLQSLNLRGCQNLVEVDPSVGFLDRLNHLSLEFCYRLETVPMEVSWKSMRSLLVPYCGRLENFINIVHEIASLKTLRLSNSGIKELHSWIGRCTSLEHLALDGTPIKQLPSTIGNLTSVTKLRLSRTLLKELPYSIGCLTSLVTLDASKSLIEVLPSSIGDLTSLRELYMFKTPLKELPSSIGCLTSLRELDVSDTLVEKLPSSIGNLTSLKELRLNNTLIEKLPPSVGNLTSLESLELSKTPLKELPSSIGSLTSLRKLDASETLIEGLPLSIGKFLNLDSLFLGGCKRLRDISELPPNLELIELDDCVLLERFSKLSDILEQKDTPGLLCLMTLSNCNRMMDNLGIDLVSKMAKALPYQMVQAGLDQHVLSWDLMLPSLLEIEVPKWFDRGEVDASVLPGQETGDMCEILIRIPRNLKAEKIGFVVCVVFGITRRGITRHLPKPFPVTVVIDNKQYDGRRHYFEARPTESFAHDHVSVCLICIAFKELELVDRVVRVICYYHGSPLKSFGVHLLANMQENDGDHVSGEYLAQERYRDGNASISDLENIDGAAVASFVSDDSFTGEVHDDHDEGEPERELHRPTKRFRWQ